MTFRINDHDGHKRVALGNYGKAIAGQSGVESLTKTQAVRQKLWVPPKPARYVLSHGADLLWTSDFVSFEPCQRDGADFTLNYRREVAWNQSLGMWIGNFRSSHDNTDRMYRSLDGKTWEAPAASVPAAGGWVGYTVPGTTPAYPSVGSRIYVLHASEYTAYPNKDVKIQYTDDAFDTVHDVPGASWSSPSSNINCLSVSPDGKRAVVLFDRSPIEYVVSTDFDQPTPTWTIPDTSAALTPAPNLTLFNDGTAFGCDIGYREHYTTSVDGALAVFTTSRTDTVVGFTSTLGGVAEMVNTDRIIAIAKTSSNGVGRVWDKSLLVGTSTTLDTNLAVSLATSGCKPLCFCWDPSGEHIIGCRDGLIKRTLDDGVTWETAEALPGLSGTIDILAQNPLAV